MANMFQTKEQMRERAALPSPAPDAMETARRKLAEGTMQRAARAPTILQAADQKSRLTPWESDYFDPKSYSDSPPGAKEVIEGNPKYSQSVTATVDEVSKKDFLARAQRLKDVLDVANKTDKRQVTTTEITEAMMGMLDMPQGVRAMRGFINRARGRAGSTHPGIRDIPRLPENET